MKRSSVKACIGAARCPIVREDVHGIEIRRARFVYFDGRVFRIAALFGAWHEEVWRVYSGGGIAGNSDQWWLRQRGRSTDTPLGPFTNQRALTKVLRAWREYKLP